MSSPKRRKVEPTPASPVSAVSAIAQRRAAAAAAAAQAQTQASLPQTQDPSHDVEDEADESVEEPPKSKAKGKRKRKVTVKVERVEKIKPPQNAEASQETIDSMVLESTPESDESPPPRAPSPPSPSAIPKSTVSLSTLTPTKENTTIKPNGVVELKLNGGERFVILGSYGVRVVSGEAAVYGANVRPSDAVAWVHAPHCHAVPVIRTSEQTVLELLPHPHGESLQRLEGLSPLFRKLWHNPRPEGKKAKIPTFQIMYTSDDVPKRATVQDLVVLPEWNKALAEITRSKVPTVFVCGPKGSGKSTFCRLLHNKMVTSQWSKARATGVAVLDLDPGQPEFAPAGILSLVHGKGPNMSPPFAHAIAGNTLTIHRSHAMGSLTPASDPQLFIETCLDLFSHYSRSLSHCPLIINTPGWIQGTGLDLLVDLMASMNPSHVVYMSEEGPAESVDTLNAAARGQFIPLPSQQSELTLRTAAHLRAMQMLSYFHGRVESGIQAWDPTPISAKVPWEVRYGGANSGIAAVLCYEYQPPAELLAEAINGSTVSLVEIEDAQAFKGLVPNDSWSDAVDSSSDAVDSSSDAMDVDSVNPQSAIIPQSAILSTPEGIPFIPNPDSRFLNPRHSRALGHVLIRGIDASRQSLQLLTPVPAKSIRQARASGHALVLVLGRLDAPAWAYTEELYDRAVQADTRDDDESDYEEVEGEARNEAKNEARRVAGAEVPWVETLEGDEKRPVGSKAWRVRRDLGRD